MVQTLEYFDREQAVKSTGPWNGKCWQLPSDCLSVGVTSPPLAASSQA